jgi:hypothetical protein
MSYFGEQKGVPGVLCYAGQVMLQLEAGIERKQNFCYSKTENYMRICENYAKYIDTPDILFK